MSEMDDEEINTILVKIIKATIMCMDHSMADIVDDDKYDRAVDLQNELREMLAELQERVPP